MEFTTAGGALVRITPVIEDEHDVRGALLTFAAQNRRTQVYLGPNDVHTLENALHRWRTELAEQWANPK
jgi:hypothetical protein